MFSFTLIFFINIVFVCLQKLCKEDESLEGILENVIVLRQTLESATDTPATAETEPTLPPPETLGALFNHRYCLVLWMTQLFTVLCIGVAELNLFL